jgi:glycosyltransferase involved in cell wall biosynthesis
MQKYTWEKKVKLNIVWDGPDRKKLEKLSESLGISKNVTFYWLIPVTKVREEFLPSLHIFINPSLQEWLPTTVIEALISWSSVIATDVWWTREILRYAQFLLVAPRSVKAISLAIEQSVNSIDTKSTSNIPVSLFSWEQTFREFWEVYNLIK